MINKSVTLDGVSCTFDMMQKRKTKFEKWFSENRNLYEELGTATKTIIEATLRHHAIPFLSVTARAKTLKSALLKVKTKEYRNPTSQMTDLTGLRIITYTETDAHRICEIIPTIFSIDSKKSIDKSARLNQDKVGYRSVHFICQFENTRLELIEFKKFKSFIFEIQVRTVLEHAWAEIQHSRSYKFAGVLPIKLERSLNLIAGLLEVADNQIAQLDKSIDEYKKELSIKTKKGDLNLELTTDAIRTFAKTVQPLINGIGIIGNQSMDSYVSVIQECIQYGITNVEELKVLLTSEFISAYQKTQCQTTDIGLVRDLMMFADLEAYFSKAYTNGWSGADTKCVAFLLNKYERSKIDELFKHYEIEIYDDPNEDDDEPPLDDEPTEKI